MQHHAHTKSFPDGKLAPESEWEPLFTTGCDTLQGRFCAECDSLSPHHGHLNKVAYLSGKFAAEMLMPGTSQDSAGQWGYLAGLWHDLGKFAPAWQDYLKSKADPHQADVGGRLDHSTAGAKHAISVHSLLGPLMAYMIAGHHAGLADGHTLFPEAGRLNKLVEAWLEAAQASGVPLSLPLPMPPLTRPNAGNDSMAVLVRFLFSSLVDADFLATEAFMEPHRADLRPQWPHHLIDRMLASVQTHLTTKFANARNSAVNTRREGIREACEKAAEERPGFFSLTVPTGGGKTLSSLLFALRHARKHGMRRVIYVIPYTSIITQNADVFRDALSALSKELGLQIVLEHHSKFDPAKETEVNRLAAENWDAPLIVTTNVQFFESLFANRTSACRKLHRIARSVIIFDEVQALPVRLLHPVLRSLTNIVKDLHCTAVLCTATQPALDQRHDFSIGIPPSDIHPIIEDEEGLFQSMKRVAPEVIADPLSDDELVGHILSNAHAGCLLVLNTTKAAQTLHERLSHHLPAFHLSARMCPRHIMTVLARVKLLRQREQPVVLVSTQLIEAGVDVSFPVVYRAECGLDSFAQAAGRCNRNGELELPGKVFFFSPKDHPLPNALHDLKSAAEITRTQILPSHRANLLSLSAIRQYFEQAIWQAGPKTKQWDAPEIVSGGMACFDPAGRSLDSWNFKTAAERFRLIDSITHPILIPWGPVGKALAAEIRQWDKIGRPLNRFHYRRAQAFTVQVYENEWIHMQHHVSLHADGAIAILEHPENYYHPDTGLKRSNTQSDPNAFYL